MAFRRGTHVDGGHLGRVHFSVRDHRIEMRSFVHVVGVDLWKRADQYRLLSRRFGPTLISKLDIVWNCAGSN